MTRRRPDPVTRAFELIARYAEGAASDEAEEAALLEIWRSGAITPSVEHAQLYSGGQWLLWPGDPELERILPTALRIEQGQRNGGTVGRRTVVVIQDWTKVRRRRAGTGH